MNRKKFVCTTIIFLLLGIFCSQLASITSSSVTEIIAFPFSLIAKVLRNLSLKNEVGNIIAIVLYCVISCIPVLLYIFLKKRSKLDLYLPILSCELFIILYLLINPQAIQIPFLSWTLDIFMTTNILSYISLKVIKIAKEADKNILSLYFAYALRFIVIAFIFIGIFMNILSYTNEIQPILQPTYISKYKQYTCFILLLEHLVFAIPYIFNAYITNECSLSLQKLSKQAYDETLKNDIHKITNITYFSIITIIITNLILQMLRILFLSKITDINVALEFPFFSIIFLLTILLLSKLISENIDLKKDNDLFI